MGSPYGLYVSGLLSFESHPAEASMQTDVAGRALEVAGATSKALPATSVCMEASALSEEVLQAHRFLSSGLLSFESHPAEASMQTDVAGRALEVAGATSKALPATSVCMEASALSEEVLQAHRFLSSGCNRASSPNYMC
ncbi:unnamed protein product [Leuciscus chuanchicus]